MSDSFSRKINRNHIRALLLAQARAHGCTCQPDIKLPSLQRGKVRVTTLYHDNDCPHYRDPAAATQLAARINAGEFDAER